MPGAVTDWGLATWTGFTAGLASFWAWVPALLGALALLLVGWLASSLVATLILRLLEAARFDAYIARSGLEDALHRAGLRVDPAGLVAALGKWAVRLVALMLAADALRLPALATGIARVLAYLPNLAAAAAILALGLAGARVLAAWVLAVAPARTRELWAAAARFAVLALAGLAALGQLGVAPALVQTLYTAAIGALALAAALAFGLGLREQARDVVAGQALAEQLREGDEITVDQVRGRIARIGALTTLIHTGDGFTSVPNRRLVEELVRIHGYRNAPLGGGGGGAARPPSWRARRHDDVEPS